MVSCSQQCISLIYVYRRMERHRNIIVFFYYRPQVSTCYGVVTPRYHVNSSFSESPGVQHLCNLPIINRLLQPYYTIFYYRVQHVHNRRVLVRMTSEINRSYTPGDSILSTPICTIVGTRRYVTSHYCLSNT